MRVHNVSHHCQNSEILSKGGGLSKVAPKGTKNQPSSDPLLRTALSDHPTILRHAHRRHSAARTTMQPQQAPPTSRRFATVTRDRAAAAALTQALK